MRHPLAIATASFALAAVTAAGRQEAPAPAAADYGRDVVPILEAHCLRCHNAIQREGGLLMDAHDELMRGGDTGPAVTPGDAAGSLIVRLVEGREKPYMPPKGAKLAAEEIDVLRRWIAAGAAYSPTPRVPIDARVPGLSPVAPAAPQVAAAAFRPDGGELTAAGYKQVRRFDLPSGRPRPALDGLSDLVRALAWSPDGSRLAAGSGIPGAFGEVAVFDAATGERLHDFVGHRDYVYHVAFSHSGRLLASCGYDRQIRLWDLERGRPFSVLREHTEAVYAVAFSPDDALVASAAADRSVKVWKVEDGTRLYTLTDAADAVTSLAFHPDGRRLSAAGTDKAIRTWEVTPDGGRLVRTTFAHAAGVLRIAYSPDGRWLASAGADRAVKIWDAETGAEVRSLEPQADWAQALAWSPDARLLAVGRDDGSLSVYHAESGRRTFDPLPARKEVAAR